MISAENAPLVRKRDVEKIYLSAKGENVFFLLSPVTFPVEVKWDQKDSQGFHIS
jgi:hypothetical protein